MLSKITSNKTMHGRLAIAAAAAAAATASAQVSDDFESYAPGAFPAPLWLDPGLLNPDPPNPPDPSAVIAETPDATGALTKAVSIIDAVAPTQGVYTPLTIGPRVRIAGDVRIDQWCDVPSTPQDDWAVWVQVGVSMPRPRSVLHRREHGRLRLRHGPGLAHVVEGCATFGL